MIPASWIHFSRDLLLRVWPSVSCSGHSIPYIFRRLKRELCMQWCTALTSVVHPLRLRCLVVLCLTLLTILNNYRLDSRRDGNFPSIRE